MKLSGKKGTEQSKKKSVGKAKKASEVIKVPGDWLYMTPQEIGVRQIYEAFGEQDGYELEIWEDAGVLEIGMSEGASVDIETAQIHPKDELTASFAAEHQVKTVFLVTFKPETYEEAKRSCAGSWIKPVDSSAEIRKTLHQCLRDRIEWL